MYAITFWDYFVFLLFFLSHTNVVITDTLSVAGWDKFHLCV